MTKREQRVINAFCNCVRSGEFTPDYAVTLIEDRQRYGWLSEDAIDAFYAFLDAFAPAVEEEPVEEPAADPDEEPAEDPEETPAEEEPPADPEEGAPEQEA